MYLFYYQRYIYILYIVYLFVRVIFELSIFNHFFMLKTICILILKQAAFFFVCLVYSISLVEKNGASSGTASYTSKIRKKEEQIAQLSLSYRGGKRRQRGKMNSGRRAEGTTVGEKGEESAKKKILLARWGDAISCLTRLICPCWFLFFPLVSFLVTLPYCWKLYACPVRLHECSSCFMLGLSPGLSLYPFRTPCEILHQRLEIKGDKERWGDLGIRRESVWNYSKSI